MKRLLAAIVVAGLAFAACQKEYSIENGETNSLTGAWEFKDSTNTRLSGNSTQYYIDDTTNTASAQMVYTGATANLGATISISVFFPTGTATTGSFQSANGQVNFLYLFNNTGKLYKVDALAGQFSTENITVNITQITDSSITGTFSGTALDSANRVVPIKEGKFSYRGKSTTAPPPATSVGTLGSATDTCTGAVVSGTYKKSTALTATNTVRLTVNVTTPGTYTIASDTLKGISFKGTGSFTATGVQSVTIAGVGTPTDSGSVRFRVRYGTSNCTFLVKIDTITGIGTGPDYFPTTANSNWSYDNYSQTGTALDTVYVFSTGTFRTLLGSPYSIFLQDDGTTIDSFYYRKNAGIYYNASNATRLFTNGMPQATQLLKDNVPVGSTWADTFAITVNGQNLLLKQDYTILAKAVPAIVNSFSFMDVIKVRAVVNTNVTGVFIPIQTIETWYARGTGIIYQKTTSQSSVPNTFEETKLRRYVVTP